MRVERIRRAAGGGQADTDLREGIGQDQGLAAAQDELVDGIALAFRQVAGVGQHDDVGVGGNFLPLAQWNVDIEESAQGLRDRVGAAFAPHCRLYPARSEIQREGRDHHQFRQVGIGQAIDHAGQVVFQEPAPFRLEEGDGFLIIGRVLPDQAEIEGVAACAQRHAAQAGVNGAVLVFREGFRVDQFQADASAGDGAEFLQHAHDPVRVVADFRYRPGEGRRVVELHGDVFLQPGEHVAGAVGQGVEAVLGQIQATVFQAVVGNDVDGEEQDGQQADTAEGDELVAVEPIHGSVLSPRISCIR